MRFAAYTGTSVALATGVIVRALHQRANFYSACVYLAQSNACLMILTNVAMLGVSMTMLGLQKLFYGPLRPVEVEQLYEKAWFAVTETCLAMTIFREEVGGWFLVMFVGLLIGKVWGWIGEGRVEVLEQQPPANPRLFHARLSVSLCISAFFNASMVSYSVATVLQHARPNMMVMFAFEFAVLLVSSTSTTARYLISLREAAIIKTQTRDRKAQIRREREQIRAATQASEDVSLTSQSNRDAQQAATEDGIDLMDIDVPGWEEKGRWVFYLDLTTDFCKLVLYLTFFCVLCMFYGMPIHIIRDVALTIRSFHKRITDFVRYRQATRDMNARYPDATSEEVNREDCCIICREDMRAWSQRSTTGAPSEGSAGEENTRAFIDERLRPKKLPCGHILHFACLRSWLERQQNCPTCRAPVLVPNAVVQPQVQNAPNQAARGLPQLGVPQLPFLGQVNGQPPHIPGQNIIQFGPLRIAFGARNGVQGIPQQPNQQPDAPMGADNVTQFRNPLGSTQQEPENQMRTVASFSPVTPSVQLQYIEQQLMREINSLRVQADQLYVVRALQNELARLRLIQANFGATNATHSTLMNQYRMGGAHSSLSNIQANGPLFTSRPSAQVIGSGHEHLPAGMTIPEGWTVLPLQRLSDAAEGGSLSSASTHHPQNDDMAVNTPMPVLATSPLPEERTTSTDTSVDPPSSTTQTTEQNIVTGTSKSSNARTHLKSPHWGSPIPASKPDGVTEASGQEVEEQAVGSNEKLKPGGIDQEKGKSRGPTVEELIDDAV